jgi:hypothetical protein
MTPEGTPGAVAALASGLLNEYVIVRAVAPFVIVLFAWILWRWRS